MKKEELKETLDILKKLKVCLSTESCEDCVDFVDCGTNYFKYDCSNAVKTAITVIEDVLKNMEALEAKKGV